MRSSLLLEALEAFFALEVLDWLMDMVLFNVVDCSRWSVLWLLFAALWNMTLRCSTSRRPSRHGCNTREIKYPTKRHDLNLVSIRSVL